ncbi:hypothetical protein G6011_11539 [Alternaria panax]|uniref:Uncharacterized protein n=1 Tax=Alternaria panax TaxID=48097 RepID=A0AAD4NTF2_9PLEO|nr:hypothetical protein G6011_11539 [Alternaria panax]
MEWIRKRRDERKRERLAARQTSLNNAHLEHDAQQAHFESAVASGPTRFFSIRRHRGANTRLSIYDLLERTGEEPRYTFPSRGTENGERLEESLQSMEIEDGEEILRNPFATPSPSLQLQLTDSVPIFDRQNLFTTPRSSEQLRPIDSISNVGQRPTPSPEADDAASQTWLERVSSTIHRKPTIKALEAYKTGGIRSAWAYTLPRNWKSRNAAASKAQADNAAAVEEPQSTRSMDDMDIDDERRSPLPTHWRDGVEAQQAFTRRTSGIAGGDSEVGDWNSPRASGDMDEIDQEFRDWANQYKMLVEQYDSFTDASKRASVLSQNPKNRYSDYFRGS